ncbi:unnamed protein product [Cuscuta campestris]|uniref:Uncharacterized protein n=2 Tax=Cuscuta sect. Cleistogrammica TaxID=1824901 RepID=A0A484LYU9_9ASTE|nr:hypothetical protein DM860_012975 [Cuscuta australis]VFQ81741.1 unnamed protein product [Cuscuta campestris]
MKKLYRKSAVHPTPPLVLDQLAFLPAAILALTVALGQGDKEVLAYLVSCSAGSFNADRKSAAYCGGKGGSDAHPPRFDCYCFSCYMSYWGRWDSSPNRQLIHEIIDAYEDRLASWSRNQRREKRKGKAGRKQAKGPSGSPPPGFSGESMNSSELSLETGESGESNSAELDSTRYEEEEEEGGAVRRFVSFVGERIWTSIWT